MAKRAGESEIVPPSRQRRSMWFDACASNDLQAVRKMLPTMARQQNGLGQTGMMLAAQRGNLAVVNALVELEHGMVDDHWQTALMYAAGEDRVECVLALAPWEAGQTDVYGKRARDYCHIRDVRFVLRQESWDDETLGVFMQFVRQKSHALNDVLCGLVRAGYETIKAERFRGTQFYAAARKLEECVERLQSAGTDVEEELQAGKKTVKARLAKQREPKRAEQRPFVS